jgi:uncharacterized protein (TIGR02147 family)
MAAQKNFKMDPHWIASQLVYKVAIKDVVKALDFLRKHDFISIKENGEVTVSDKQVDCFGGIYKLSLTEFYRQVFSLASESIEVTPSTERHILGHTFSINQNQFDEVRNLLNEVQQKIAALTTDEQPGSRVYQIGLLAFPLTDKPAKIVKDEDDESA